MRASSTHNVSKLSKSNKYFRSGELVMFSLFGSFSLIWELSPDRALTNCEAPMAHVWPLQSMPQGLQPSHMVPKANRWALIAGYMPALPPLICSLCLGSRSILAFLSARSPTLDHVGTHGTRLATPIHASMYSTHEVFPHFSSQLIS